MSKDGRGLLFGGNGGHGSDRDSRLGRDNDSVADFFSFAQDSNLRNKREFEHRYT
jgi:hypothetical protein